MTFIERLVSKIISYVLRRILNENAFGRKSFSVPLSKIRRFEVEYKDLLTEYGILQCNLRRWHFWAQLCHESGLREVRENMNYSASRLLVIFPKYFTLSQANQYARKPQAIANRVYANRMGNGNEQSGDGWKYRGGGYIQTTGKDNYQDLEGVIQGATNNPDLLLLEVNALKAALHFWRKNRLNTICDKDDIITLTRRINGGLHGLDDRRIKYDFIKSNL